MTREDHERTLSQTAGSQTSGKEGPSGQAQSQFLNPQSQSLMAKPTTVREALHQMRGDYTHGHPGLPPKDYKQPADWKRR